MRSNIHVFIDENTITQSKSDTSGVTDVELIVESHQDFLQYIHILSKMNEINFQ